MMSMRKRSIRFQDEETDDEEQLLPQQTARKERKPILKRKHAKKSRKPNYRWSNLLDFQSNYYIAKIRQNETKLWLGFEIFGLIVTVALFICCYFYFESFHYYLCRIYAHFGHADAQHKLGEKFLYGKGVDKDEVLGNNAFFCTVLFFDHEW